MKFCKKFSKYSSSHRNLFLNNIHSLALNYISKFQSTSFDDMEETKLRAVLSSIANVMKLIKNIFEGGQLSETENQDIFVKVSNSEQIITFADALLDNF